MTTALLLLVNACTCADAETKPGVLATFTDGTGRQVTSIEPALGLALKAGEAPHPRLDDRGRARWEGILNVPRSDRYRFSAHLRGEVRIQVGGKIVLDEAARETRFVEGNDVFIETGPTPLVVEFVRLPGAARLQAFWKASFLYHEPLAAPVLAHASARLTPRLAHDQMLDRGRFLVEEYSCVRCHQPASKLGEGLQHHPGPDLSTVGARVFPGWLYRWLRSPVSLASWASMPEFFSDDEAGRTEAYAVARYLASLGAARIGKLSVTMNRTSARRGEQLFAQIGCAACHSPPKKPLAKTTILPAPRSFPLTDLGNKTDPDWVAKYLADPLAGNPSGRMPHMTLVDRESFDLAHYLCDGPAREDKRQLPVPPARELMLKAFQRVDPRPDELKEFRKLPAEAQWLDLGKRIVIDKGCNNCHTIAPEGQSFANVFADKGLEDLGSAKKLGCLASDRSQRGRAPWYGLPEAERQAVQAFLGEGTKGHGSPAPAFAARWTLVRYNCLACHVRDGVGGLDGAFLEELRVRARADDVEAVTPPPLTGVGSKLRAPWLEQVLTKAGRARPWMNLRMPHFGTENMAGLAHGLAALEGHVSMDPRHRDEKAAAGKQLLGTTGFNCVACHDLGKSPGSVMRGPDLATMSTRVEYAWYRRWLQQASRMQPGTRMPSVFPDGRSTLTNVLGGDADAQAKALWDYLGQ